MSTPRRRGAAWVSLGRGVRRPVAEDGLAADLVAWQGVLPASAVFTHLTAAAMHGLWLPPLPQGLPLFVAIPKSTPRPRRPQLIVTRHPVAPPHEELEGARTATVPEALVACARDLELLDLVVLIDSALHLGKTAVEEMATVAAFRRGGASRLRADLTFVEGRSESAWESVLRMFHVAVEAPVVPQVRITDADGQFVARADLLLNGTRTVHEYDGAGHRDARQHRDDLRRERRLLAAGYPRRGFTSDDIRSRPLDILRDIDSALARPHDAGRLAAWESWWAASLFSPVGTFVLRERWGLSERWDLNERWDLKQSEPAQGAFGVDPLTSGTIVLW